MQEEPKHATLDLLRYQVVAQQKAKLADPSPEGLALRTQLRDGTLTRMVLSNGMKYDILPEVITWFNDAEIAMGVKRPDPNSVELTMTPKEWAGVKEEKDGSSVESVAQVSQPKPKGGSHVSKK